MTKRTRRSHVVPAGYQRNFADGERVRVVLKADRTELIVGVKDNFVVRGFLRAIVDGQPDDRLEDEFARLENLSLPRVRQLVPSQPLTSADSHAVRVLAAMLWARSLSREDVVRRTFRNVVDDFTAMASKDPILHAKFREEYARDPNPGEIDRILREQAEQMRRQRTHDLATMTDHYNRALEKFHELRVVLYDTVPGAELITSDNPVVLSDSNRLVRVGAHNGLALGDAGFIFVPLTRRIGACLVGGDDEQGGTLDQVTVMRLNNATWRNAVHRIAFHPSLDRWAQASGINNSGR